MRYFLAVADLLNFTKAATRLRVAQPSLSRQIRDLEDELGVTLFERNSRSVRLTKAGLRFVSEARSVLQRAEQAVESTRSFAQGDRCEIHVGFAPSLTTELLPKTLKAFEKRCPQARVNLHDLSAQEMLSRLSEGKLDAALTVGPPRRQGLTFQPLRSYPFCVAVNSKHPLARSKRLSLAQIEQERLVSYSREEYPDYYELLDLLFDRRLRAALRNAEEHDSGTSLMAAVEAGRGIAIVPSILALTAGRRLKLREFSPSPAPLMIGIAYHRRKLSPTGALYVHAALALKETGC